MTKYRDFPFDEICKAADKLCVEGYKVFQKFTCEKCGQRLSMDVPCAFFETGGCDKCGHVTNIKKRGCNYTVIGEFS